MKNKTISFNSLVFLFSAFLVACSTPTVSSDEPDEIELTSSSKSSSSSEKEKSSSSKKEASSSSDKKISSSSECVESSSANKEASSSSETKASSDKSSSSNKSDEKSSSSNKEVSSSSEQIELSSSEEQSSSSVAAKTIYEAVEESGLYTTKDSVAAYLCKFDKLPSNYVGKNKGKSLYEYKTGNTFSSWNFNPWTTIGVMIGGDEFNNHADDPNPDRYHPSLPEGDYLEADVEYCAKNRGMKRLVYQSDCVIYYTADHYETFNKLDIP